MIDFEAIALAVRAQIAPGLSPLEPAPLVALTTPHELETVAGRLQVTVSTSLAVPHHVWGMTTFEPGRAWIWLTREAWPELTRGVPRTRWSVAHELGHVVLHGEELEGLDERAEVEHHARLEAEANRFAAHLLVPDAALKRLGVKPSTAALELLAKRFGVSAVAAGKRIEEWSTR